MSRPAPALQREGLCLVPRGPADMPIEPEIRRNPGEPESGGKERARAAKGRGSPSFTAVEQPIEPETLGNPRLFATLASAWRRPPALVPAPPRNPSDHDRRTAAQICVGPDAFLRCPDATDSGTASTLLGPALRERERAGAEWAAFALARPGLAAGLLTVHGEAGAERRDQHRA